ATSDLNDLYRRIINRNNRLRRLLELRAPEIIIRNEKRMLQEAVDSLIDNGRRGRAVTGASNRPLKSLSDMLKGKQGRFRQNLLGKRVDYSGRSVIVVGPELKFYQCGLPKQMAIELFKPFVMKELVQRGMAHNIKSAKKMIDRGQDAIWDILEEVIREHPVMLNRAPTLHRLSIQAFEPVLVEGKAIKLHPLACTPFNADFDGDQMAVHVPLTYEAQTEARFLMLSANNLLKLSDGSPVNVPTQDMVLGSYYLTTERDGMVGEGKIFKDENEAIRAYFDKVVDIEAKIKLRRKVNFTSVNKKGEEVTEEVTKIIDTTVGKIIFNEIIPQDLGFVDRTDREKVCDYEINEQVSKKVLGKIIRKAIQTHDSAIVVEMLDNIKALGYHYSTISGMTISASDVLIPEEKQDRIDATTERVNKIKSMYEKGLMTKQEKHDKIVAEWSKTTDQLSEDVMKTFGPYNHIKIMADSGARGSKQQIKQLAGMRGNMAATSGEIVELPIKSCFKEGLTTLEYFLSAHGSRKSLSDTALKTADSGYLTRRLVDVAQDITIKEADCCADGLHEPNYKVVSALMEGKELIEGLSDRIAGRWSIDTIVNPETKKVIVEADHMITAKQADEIESCGITEVKIRTALTCRSRDGVCAKCYGADMANGKESRVGEAVGIIAAQSIGEPGTQLSMETKHLGGIAGKDITQGLPRVEEIFETRKPKGDALISEIGGKIKIKELENDNKQVIVKNKEQTIEYDIRHGAKLAVEDGQTIEAGDKLTEGSINPHDILEINGPERVQAYIIKEIQRAYRLQGVDINDKHVEIICRQMLKKVRIEEQGDSEHLPGVVLDLKEIEDINEELIAKKKKPAVYKQMLLGITKSSLATSSFLSAASFQETTRVLTEAAISGRADHLKGLKENIILGKIIPAGTGMKQYNSVDAKMKEVEEVVEELEAEE
ncbi:MAG: DNA-directed RNA polymerase subunit beta', partial [Clostridia bacterium]|nr:DNA-directed RNA polymerase subunit beta' [Clostridia bacterium]